METERPSTRRRPPAALMIIGGVLTLLSVFQTWFEIETGGVGLGDRTYSAIDLTLGTGLIVFSVALLIIGAMHALRPPRGRGLAIIAIVVASFIALTGLLTVSRTALALGNFGRDEVASDFGIADDDDVADVLQDAEGDDVLNVKPDIGGLIALAGGTLALLGGAFAIAHHGAARRSSVVPPDENREVRDSSA